MNAYRDETMPRWTTVIGVLAALLVALFAASCDSAVSPPTHGAHAPAWAAAQGSGIALDQKNANTGTGTPFGNGTHIGDGFIPTNPHLGDAIVATFFWRGSTNVITEVTDHLADGTMVGNTYMLVEYVTDGTMSMATYVATNVQNFPDPRVDDNGVLDVHAITSAPVTGEGIILSAYSGVAAAEAVVAHRSAAGLGSSPTTAEPGAVSVDAGALAYGVSVSSAEVGDDPPAGFTNITTASSSAEAADAEYAVQGTAGTVDPQWTWYFTSPSSWVASVVALKPAGASAPTPTHLGFLVQPHTTLPLATITPAVQVAALDAQGNLAASFTGPVTMAIGHNGALLLSGTLRGTKTVAAVNGVATFADLSIDLPGNGYTLRAAAPALAGAESAAFNVGPF